MLHILIYHSFIYTDTFHVLTDHSQVRINTHHVHGIHFCIAGDSLSVHVDQRFETYDFAFVSRYCFGKIVDKYLCIRESAVEGADVVRVGIDATCEGRHSTVEGGDVFRVGQNTILEGRDSAIEGSDMFYVGRDRILVGCESLLKST